MSFMIMLFAAPLIGSFLGVVVTRLPEGRSVVLGRSQCDHCRHVLAPADLAPIASYVWRHGRCGYCGAAIGRLHFFIELMAIAAVLWAGSLLSGPALIASCLFGWLLLALALIDWRHLLLPDALTFTLLLGGGATAAILDRNSLADHALGAAIGFAFLAGVAGLYRFVRGRDGMGFGDAKLAGASSRIITSRAATIR